MSAIWPTECKFCTTILKNRVVEFTTAVDDVGLARTAVICPGCKEVSFPVHEEETPGSGDIPLAPVGGKLP